MNVALFVTCLVDAFFPDVGGSVARLIAREGIKVSFPGAQTCCGQPAFNTGYPAEALSVARANMKAFDGFDFVVTPSGSCAAMVRHYYPELFKDQPDREAALDFAGRLYEFSEFFVDVLDRADVGAVYPGRVTYHPSCHMMRGLGVRRPPYAMLEAVEDLELVELPYAEDCCGFGGTFAVKMDEVSTAMVDEKADHVVETDADTLVSSDAGCLMNIVGRLRRRDQAKKALHLSELLAEGVFGDVRRTG